jgi:hypothetical protein
MAALVLVLMMPVRVSVLVSMNSCLMAMLVPVMGVSIGLVAVFMPMLVFVVAAHAASPPFA